MKTKIFCDIADFKVIKHYNKKKIVDGFTTNPSLIRLAGAKNYKNYCLKILKICKKKPISFEVFADKPEDMLSQAYKINKWGKNIYVKKVISTPVVCLWNVIVKMEPVTTCTLVFIDPVILISLMFTEKL